VELLLSVAPLLKARLSAPEPRLTWEARRAPLVHQLVATKYLQPDVARWIVDTWGAALGVAPAQIVRPALASAESGTGALTAPFARAVGMVPPAPARPSVATPAPLPPPSWARRSGVQRVGARQQRAGSGGGMAGALAQVLHPNAAHPAMARPVTPRWRTHSPALNPGQLAQIHRVERTAMIAVVVATVIVFVAAAYALNGRKSETVAAAAVLPLVAAGSTADSVLAQAYGPMHPLPATNGDAQRAAAASPSGAIAAPATPLTGAQVISAGIGGRYRVQQRSVTVTGSPSCEAVAQALAAARPTIEVVTHTPGTFVFELTSRAVTGTLDGDANFDAGPLRGTNEGVAWVFNMRGRFTAGGFIAETNTSTEAILRWGRTQNCTTVAELVGERLP
jgi:hypothetical protein